MDPVAVEITYGLERIAMALQKVNNFREIQWNPERTYGDVRLEGEIEHSKYYFEVADVDRLREMFNLFEAEANEALKYGLVLPAHDYVLKCSHTFNVLDTRGAIGVTERQTLFSRMRELSRQVAEAYYRQRQEMGFPWLTETAKQDDITVETVVGGDNLVTDGDAFADLIFEIGTEELPVADLKSAVQQLEEHTMATLQQNRLPYAEVKAYGTPRRLVVAVKRLAQKQADLNQIVKGPPAERAFNPDGTHTKAAEGFARGKGVTVADLQITEMDGGSYVTVQLHEEGQPTLSILTRLLPELIASLRFDKTMRWNASGVSFSRPIRWLMAIFGRHPVPFHYASLSSQKLTRGLRFQKTETIAIEDSSHYFAVMAEQGIILDLETRKLRIAEMVRSAIEKMGADSRKMDEELLDEVNLLVEAPTAFVGTFEAEYLKLPSEVLISVMKKHQRYFPVFDINGNLVNRFVAIRNGGNRFLNRVAEGNSQVVRARFADAAFFIAEDSKLKLEDYRPRLATLTFQSKLGSMLDKTERIVKSVSLFSKLLGLDTAEEKIAVRAASLAKADLVTHMVVEMTSLQGVMGLYYANLSGEKEAVGKAIYEHYLPRFAGDVVPSSKAGMVVGIADRLDSLVGLFAAGLAPSGTKDPFAQRRAALGLVQALIAWDLDFDLRQGLEIAAENMPIIVSSEHLTACFDFIKGRLQNLLIEKNFRYDIVAAILAEQSNNPAAAARAVESLTDWVARSDWDKILPTFARCARITRDLKQVFPINPTLLKEDSERELYAGITSVMTVNRRPGSIPDFFQVFMPLMPVINQFFDEVLVMAEDLAVRANRLGMLQQIVFLSKDVADFSLLEGF